MCAQKWYHCQSCDTIERHLWSHLSANRFDQTFQNTINHCMNETSYTRVLWSEQSSHWRAIECLTPCSFPSIGLHFYSLVYRVFNLFNVLQCVRLSKTAKHFWVKMGPKAQTSRWMRCKLVFRIQIRIIGGISVWNTLLMNRIVKYWISKTDFTSFNFQYLSFRSSVGHNVWMNTSLDLKFFNLKTRIWKFQKISIECSLFLLSERRMHWKEKRYLIEFFWINSVDWFKGQTWEPFAGSEEHS